MRERCFLLEGGLEKDGGGSLFFRNVKEEERGRETLVRGGRTEGEGGQAANFISSQKWGRGKRTRPPGFTMHEDNVTQIVECPRFQESCHINCIVGHINLRGIWLKEIHSIWPLDSPNHKPACSKLAKMAQMTKMSLPEKNFFKPSKSGDKNSFF